MGAKNTLNRDDAERVEQAFEARLAALANDVEDRATVAQEDNGRQRYQTKKQKRSGAIDKSVLALPTPRRVRDREHVKSVSRQPCLVCGRRPADAHHLLLTQLPTLGRKVSDEFTVPLCQGHHREVHLCSDEAAWWKKTGIDPSTAARVLWLKTRSVSRG